MTGGVHRGASLARWTDISAATLARNEELSGISQGECSTCIAPLTECYGGRSSLHIQESQNNRGQILMTRLMQCQDEMCFGVLLLQLHTNLGVSWSRAEAHTEET